MPHVLLGSKRRNEEYIPTVIRLWVVQSETLKKPKHFESAALFEANVLNVTCVVAGEETKTTREGGGAK